MTPANALPTQSVVPSDIGQTSAEWEVVRFAQAVSIAEGQVDPRQEPYASMRHVGPENIEPATGRLSNCRTAREAGLISGKYLFRPGDVVYSKIRPYLRKSVYADSGGLCSADMYPLRPRSGLDAQYVHYFILSDAFTHQAVSHQDRTGIPKINRNQLSTILISKPSLSEQRAIAAVLSKIQAAVEVQDSIVARLRELKAATMAKLFREGLRGEPVKQTEIGEIPESWAVSRFGDFATLQRGYDLPVHERRPGTIPVVGSNGIVGNHSNPAVKGPGVITGRSGTIGLSFFCEQDFWPLNTALFVSSFHGNDPSFAHYLFEVFDFRRYSAGVSVPTLNRNLVHQALLAVPPVSEQAKMAAILRRLDSTAGHAESRRNALKSLFSSMLHVLMTGQVRVPLDLIGRLGAPPGAAQGSSANGRQSRAAGQHGKPDEAMLQEIVRRIVAAVAPKEIILFGSAARGEMGPDSDIDLLVVKACEHRREVARAVRDCLRGVAPGRGKDVVVVTPEDVERDRDTIGYIIRPARRDGRVLYAA